MKTRFLLTALVAMISFVISPCAFAQIIDVPEANIDWSKYASTIEEVAASGEPIYLYAPAQAATGNKAGFLAMGGTYGAYGVMKDMGQRLKIVNASGYPDKYSIQTSCNYCLDSTMPGYLGLRESSTANIAFDRSNGTQNDKNNSYAWAFNFTPTESSFAEGVAPSYYISTQGYTFTFTAGSTTSGTNRQATVTVQGTRVGSTSSATAGYSLIYRSSDNQLRTTTYTRANSFNQKTVTLPGTYSSSSEAKAAAQAAINNNLKDYPSEKATLMSDFYGQLRSKNSGKSAVKWYIVSYSDYVDLIMAQEGQTYINVTGLISDPRFERNNQDQSEWEWDGSTNGYHIALDRWFGTESGTGDNIAKSHGSFYAAEVSGEGKLTQTVEVPKPGLYAVICQGFYYGDEENENSYLYAQSGTNEQQVLLSNLTSSDERTFEGYCDDLNDQFDDLASNKKSLANINPAAGQFLAENDMWAADEDIYLNQVFVKVEQLDGSTDPYTITFGINKTSATTGKAYADNFKLVYIGDKEILFDERETTKQDNEEYVYPVTLNLRRTFTLNAWNPIILPMKLSGNQVKQAFGNGDAKLSVLKSLTQSTWGTGSSYCINFEKVDLDKQGIEPGKCYIVYVTKGPNITGTTDAPYKMPINATDTKDITGPIYQFAIESQAAYSASDVEGTSPDGKIDYVGYYLKQNGGYQTGDFIMDKGDMYHLDQAWGSAKYASEWYLRVPAIDGDASSVKFTMSINKKDEGEATGIIDIKVMNEPAFNGNDKTAIYNVSGQKVSGDINTLPKGVYIQNGRKFIVK